MIELQDRHDGTENLFAHDSHIVATIVEHRRSDEIAFIQTAGGNTITADQLARAFGAPAIDVGEHFLHVLLRD